jgi:U3 small nucleolar RNA-associated protein 25
MSADYTTTRLLTLLNVSAVKAGKRKRTYEDTVPGDKLNKRKSARISLPEIEKVAAAASNGVPDAETEENAEIAEDKAEPEATEDAGA